MVRWGRLVPQGECQIAETCVAHCPLLDRGCVYHPATKSMLFRFFEGSAEFTVKPSAWSTSEEGRYTVLGHKYLSSVWLAAPLPVEGELLARGITILDGLDLLEGT